MRAMCSDWQRITTSSCPVSSDALSYRTSSPAASLMPLSGVQQAHAAHRQHSTPMAPSGHHLPQQLFVCLRASCVPRTCANCRRRIHYLIFRAMALTTSCTVVVMLTLWRPSQERCIGCVRSVILTTTTRLLPTLALRHCGV